MEIYLTFDDGVQAGTEEVLTVLQETGVKASFFLIGAELHYAYKKSPAKLHAILKQLYEHHDIGNHSYSHGNFYFPDYYLNNGVQIDAAGNRRSIIEDFEKNRQLLNHLLQEAIGDTYKEPESRLARLPGRNTFYTRSAHAGNNNGLYRCEKGTEAVAEALHANGYNLFGWNLEWAMSFDFHKEAIELKKAKESTAGINYEVEEDVYPCIDMYDAGNCEKDRLIEDWERAFGKIMAKAATKDKIILLMHERAFRRGGTSENEETDKLYSLINKLKTAGAVFKGLSEWNG
jgi:peptidoglycan/xylan/chitin deacetylase (PgdA/CDA1 family)